MKLAKLHTVSWAWVTSFRSALSIDTYLLRLYESIETRIWVKFPRATFACFPELPKVISPRSRQYRFLYQAIYLLQEASPYRQYLIPLWKRKTCTERIIRSLIIRIQWNNYRLFPFSGTNAVYKLSIVVLPSGRFSLSFMPKRYEQYSQYIIYQWLKPL